MAIWKALARAEPGNTEYPGKLAAALGAAGHRRLDQGEVAAGCSDLRLAVDILEHLSFPRPPTFTISPVSTPYSVGPPAEGRPRNAASQARSDADRAIAAFRQAVAAGFRDNGLAQTDGDLIPIRSRPDFQVLLLDMAFPVNSFAP